MTALRERWDRFWFRPVPATNLCVSRAIFFGCMFAFYFGVDYSSYADVPRGFWQPMLLFRALHLPVLPEPLLQALAVAWKAALLLSCVGLWTRASVATSLVIGVYLLGLPHNFGKINHSDAILVFCMGVLAFSRCGDAWSIDGLVRAARAARRSIDPRPQPSGEYLWPVRMIWLVMAIVFFAAGLAKLRHSGLTWITGGDLGVLLVRHQYSHSPASRLGLVIAQFPWLVLLFAAGSVAVEILMPLALVSRVMRRVLVPSIFLMQIGIGLLMGVWFTQFFIAYAFWIPWDRVLARLKVGRAAPAEAGRVNVLFDGSCGFCRSTVAVLDRLDLLGRLRPRDVWNDWPSVNAEFPALTQDACLEDMHVVSASGAVTQGFYGYRVIARQLPLAWPVLPLLYVPGVPAVGCRVYGAVAAMRVRNGCSLSTDPNKPGELCALGQRMSNT